MAPQPTQPIGFPALSDEFLDVLYAIWTFVRDLGLVLWSYVSEPFWDVWTYPPFETFRNEFVAALTALMGYGAFLHLGRLVRGVLRRALCSSSFAPSVSAHPVTATAIAVLAFVVIPAVLNALAIVVLHCLARCRERGRRGVLRGTYI